MKTQTNKDQEQQIQAVNEQAVSLLKNQIKLTVPATNAVITSTVPNVSPSINSPVITRHPPINIATNHLAWLLSAIRAIERKAEQLGWVGAAISDIEPVGEGYFIRYEAADIYYSRATGAHEVHGDISIKYYRLGAAKGILGFPLTDETVAPDGIGRYSHFQGGSIYWTPGLGPKMVRGAIRDVWAAQGWERGALGYPVSDEHVKSTNPAIEYWSKFQNGAIYSKNGIAAQALVAEISPQDLTNFVRKTFDRDLKAVSPDLGIEGGINVLNISDWGYSLDESGKRMITYEINGFYSTGAFVPIPDPTFRLELQFLFTLTWERYLFGEPAEKTLVIYLGRPPHISTEGVFHGTFNKILDIVIPNKFPLAVQSISHEARLIDVRLTEQGGLEFLLEPDVDYPPAGEIRRIVFQDALNYFLEQ